MMFTRFSFRPHLLLSLCVVASHAGCGGGEGRPTAPSGPRATEREPEITDLEAKLVAFSLRNKEADARRCFADFESPGARLRGSVALEWLVAASGSVSEARVEQSSVEPAAVGECLAEFVKQLHYPAREGMGRARWTFVRGLGDDEVLERAKAQARLDKRNKGKSKDATRYEGASVDESSAGRLPTARIESVAEAGFELYAHCLRSGLDRNIKLRGRAVLRFVIDDLGHVETVEEAGSDLADLEVLDCIAQGLYALEFPPPEGGPVTVTYPIFLNEGD